MRKLTKSCHSCVSDSVKWLLSDPSRLKQRCPSAAAAPCPIVCFLSAASLLGIDVRHVHLSCKYGHGPIALLIILVLALLIIDCIDTTRCFIGA